jgi:hypothetical protein
VILVTQGIFRPADSSRTEYALVLLSQKGESEGHGVESRWIG